MYKSRGKIEMDINVKTLQNKMREHYTIQSKNNTIKYTPD